ncbi:rhamnogalacturonan lyase family protein [Fulvivirga sediminis]|uniref:T9SS type A sorting domain-containing protein n=1 Tax=Fulvivirga sediminis TaxID=2803949 RepID=A0A937K1W1_9BACT|nr:T9SS type A sorting domain-containing protein [Fulvivirga sediminis]MBL3658989.1 T9SS type A sorting domain-containing protein [Fulvivirga sediminis]
MLLKNLLNRHHWIVRGYDFNEPMASRVFIQSFPTHNIYKYLIILIMLLFVNAVNAQNLMENLNRGVVAVRTSNSQVFVSWRMFGTDPSNIAFNLYRGSTKVNATPITNSTNYVDNTSTNASYSVRPVINGVEQAASEAANVWGQNYKTVNLQRPPGGATPSGSYTYSPNDCSVGDLDGDGEYEIIVKWDPSNSKDNSQSGYTGKVFLDAYKLNGTQLWRVDLGWNIRAGAHYTQFMVYDFDSDGKAEVVCKTADGTTDGQGNVIGNPSADWRNSSGYVLDGPEYLTVFNGQTGAAMHTVNYLPGRGNVCNWGDCYGNRVDRFLGGIAYLDGRNPSIIMSRGYYTRSVIAAWDYSNGQLRSRWVFDTNNGWSNYAGKGNHQLSVADVDFDGRDEIVYGAMVVDDNGRGLYTSTWGHGDAMHVSDLIPSRPGLEVFTPIEDASSNPSNGKPAVVMRDARTGSIIWAKYKNGDIGRGLSADIMPEYPGAESWASSGLGVYSSTGDLVSTNIPSINFAIWWDGDLSRELLDGTTISKYNSGVLLSPTGVGSNNGTKATPNLSADLLGDWREEVVWRTSDNQSLRIYTTTATTNQKLYTLMHNPQYRAAIAWQNSGYNQPPWTSYYLGSGMSTPPQPNIELVNGGNPGVGNLMVRARGEGGGEVIEVRADGNTVASFTLSTNYQNYYADGSGNITVHFVNDDTGLDVQVDYIMVDGVTIQSEDRPTNTSVWQDDACGGSYSEWMHCNGYIDYGTLDTPTVTTIQESTQGFCSVEGAIENNHSGYTGNGFVNSANSYGSGINWRVNFNTSGTYTFTWRYANGGVSGRTARLLIDGAPAVSSIAFPNAAWTSWNTVSVTANISAGAKTVRLEATQADGLANIDYIQITGPASATDCNVNFNDLATTKHGLKTEVISEQSSEDLLLYPNPSNGLVNIVWKGDTHKGAELKVYDSNGHLITDHLVVENQFKLDVSDFPEGIYIITLTTEQQTLSKKFIK